MNKLRKILIAVAALLSCWGSLAQPLVAPKSDAEGSTTNYFTTNGPAVFATSNFTILPRMYTNSGGGIFKGPQSKRIPPIMTNFVFDHFLPSSLNHLVWTNLIAHTNGRSTRIWAERKHPPGWPATPPIATWNTNGLMWGMKGLTALSPCWEIEGNPGQVPITALTRRHGYTRGHGLGPVGLGTNLTGKKVWFVTTNNQIVQATVAREIVRTYTPETKRDYTIVLFSEDLPSSIEPMRVTSLTNLLAWYPPRPGAPYPIMKTEQGGYVSAEVPGFSLDTWKGGDSGSPNMLPVPGELVFFGGRSTSGPSPEMQADMDQLCQLQGLDPKRYQLQWVDLAAIADHAP